MRFRKRKHINILAILIIVVVFIAYYLINNFNFIDKEDISTVLLNDTNKHIAHSKYIFENTLKKVIYNSFYNISEIEMLDFKNTNPLVYIYNTHDKEGYLDYGNVYDAAKMLEEKLENIGIETVVETEKVSPYLDTSKSTFFQAYAISRSYFEKVINTYPDLRLIIDLHRDSIPREASFVSINGKSYAKVLFVQGVRYDKYEKNLSLVNKISDKLNNKYKGISKGVMIKDKSYQHDSYNQDLSIYALLLELGSNNTNFEEVSNTIDVLVPIIKEVIDEKSY